VHRIGRTGRAGRNGLAVTLAERMDTGMIRRIQHFTTQNIPVAVVAGLEPKSPAPKLVAPRAEGRFAGKPPGRDADRGKRFGKPFPARRDNPFTAREANPFERREPAHHAGRKAVDGKGTDGRGAFTPRPGSGAGTTAASRPAPRPGAKPQRPRTGGYSR
jgi:superfamily II DNA/RNA helicase